MARPKKNSPAPARAQRNQLRIIGGQWRGRKLSFPDGEGLRPTNDRVRETLFNWLMAQIPGAHCLDAFAGSGALGFEALSRGALSAILWDSNPAAITRLKDNATLLGANCEIRQGDALQLLQQPPSRAVDVVFLDPPFALNLLAPAAQALEEGHWLHPGSHIYTECGAGSHDPLPANWQLYREKKAGEVCYRVYVRE